MHFSFGQSPTFLHAFRTDDFLKRDHSRQQGLCGTIVSEQTFPDFNPGTLNYRIRQRELLRIDRANSALLHRLETTSSGYNKALLKPKHFQEPHMGLFPR